MMFFLDRKVRKMVIYFMSEEKRIRQVQWLHFSTKVKNWRLQLRTTESFFRSSVSMWKILTDLSVVCKIVETCFPSGFQCICLFSKMSSYHQLEYI
jgi:hypothetical protein